MSLMPSKVQTTHLSSLHPHLQLTPSDILNLWSTQNHAHLNCCPTPPNGFSPMEVSSSCSGKLDITFVML